MEYSEKRESRHDLEIGKAHLSEILDQLTLLKPEMDQDKNDLAFKIKNDLEKVTNTLELKQEVKRVQDLYAEASKMVLRRREDKDRLNEIHRQIQEIESRIK